jgi:hypothetical protein
LQTLPTPVANVQIRTLARCGLEAEEEMRQRTDPRFVGGRPETPTQSAAGSEDNPAIEYRYVDSFTIDEHDGHVRVGYFQQQPDGQLLPITGIVISREKWEAALVNLLPKAMEIALHKRDRQALQ